MRDIIRICLRIPELTSLWEVLVNMMNAQYAFKDRHSQTTYIIQMADIAVCLIYYNIEDYLPEAV